MCELDLECVKIVHEGLYCVFRTRVDNENIVHVTCVIENVVCVLLYYIVFKRGQVDVGKATRQTTAHGEASDL